MRKQYLILFTVVFFAISNNTSVYGQAALTFDAENFIHNAWAKMKNIWDTIALAGNWASTGANWVLAIQQSINMVETSKKMIERYTCTDEEAKRQANAYVDHYERGEAYKVTCTAAIAEAKHFNPEDSWEKNMDKGFDLGISSLRDVGSVLSSTGGFIGAVDKGLTSTGNSITATSETSETREERRKANEERRLAKQASEARKNDIEYQDADSVSSSSSSTETSDGSTPDSGGEVAVQEDEDKTLKDAASLDATGRPEGTALGLASSDLKKSGADIQSLATNLDNIYYGGQSLARIGLKSFGVLSSKPLDQSLGSILAKGNAITGAMLESLNAFSNYSNTLGNLNRDNERRAKRRLNRKQAMKESKLYGSAVVNSSTYSTNVCKLSNSNRKLGQVTGLVGSSYQRVSNEKAYNEFCEVDDESSATVSK